MMSLSLKCEISPLHDTVQRGCIRNSSVGENATAIAVIAGSNPACSAMGE